ncbi:hypothetical protein P775_11220 [Puniceibacterium antarcticum]|uniref:Uncharacterized protein n=1 Tax=Puniceibacterium antarcticum TaxID=1206336 RepID=A0A2G8RF70_9RHOB|nr:hypothetical protein P775_11220 [Puniceibacterium antarcticum]
MQGRLALMRSHLAEFMPSSAKHCTKWRKQAYIVVLYSGRRFMSEWKDHLKDEEKQRVEVIYERRQRLKARDREFTEEIQRIMNRAIRRMRRAKGKS